MSSPDAPKRLKRRVRRSSTTRNVHVAPATAVPAEAVESPSAEIAAPTAAAAVASDSAVGSVHDAVSALPERDKRLRSAKSERVLAHSPAVEHGTIYESIPDDLMADPNDPFVASLPVVASSSTASAALPVKAPASKPAPAVASPMKQLLSKLVGSRTKARTPLAASTLFADAQALPVASKVSADNRRELESLVLVQSAAVADADSDSFERECDNALPPLPAGDGETLQAEISATFASMGHDWHLLDKAELFRLAIEIALRSSDRDGLLAHIRDVLKAKRTASARSDDAAVRPEISKVPAAAAVAVASSPPASSLSMPERVRREGIAFKDVTRSAAADQLSQLPKGSFLVRPSSVGADFCSLTYRHGLTGAIGNVVIQSADGKWVLSGSAEAFSSLKSLLRRLPCGLTVVTAVPSLAPSSAASHRKDEPLFQETLERVAVANDGVWFVARLPVEVRELIFRYAHVSARLTLSQLSAAHLALSRALPVRLRVTSSSNRSFAEFRDLVNAQHCITAMAIDAGGVSVHTLAFLSLRATQQMCLRRFELHVPAYADNVVFLALRELAQVTTLERVLFYDLTSDALFENLLLPRSVRRLALHAVPTTRRRCVALGGARLSTFLLAVGPSLTHLRVRGMRGLVLPTPALDTKQHFESLRVLDADLFPLTWLAKLGATDEKHAHTSAALGAALRTAPSLSKVLEFVEAERYYWGALEREAADAALRGKPAGTFLVRLSERKLQLVVSSNVVDFGHVLVGHDDGGVFWENDEKRTSRHATLNELLEEFGDTYVHALPSPQWRRAAKKRVRDDSADDEDDMLTTSDSDEESAQWSSDE
jgi:hypothetical protein